MRSIEHTSAFVMHLPVGTLFPLFSPEGEKKWVPEWDYENLMGSTELSEDYVFLTRTHDHRSTDAIWIVKRYEPDSHLVQFYKLEPENKVGVITVECSELGPELTRVQVTYKYMALSARGETFISQFDKRAYEAFIHEWKILLIEYFETIEQR